MLERPIEFNSLVFNDQAKRNLSASPYYWIKATSVDGLFGEEIRYESHPIAGGDGERSGTPFKSGKQLVLSGEIWALNLRLLRLGEWALQEAFWTSAKSKLYFQPWPVYAANSAEFLYFNMRVSQPLIITDSFADGVRMKQNWTVGFRSDDPRPYRKSNDALYFSWQA